MKKLLIAIISFFLFTLSISPVFAASGKTIDFESEGSNVSVGLRSLPICWLFSSGCDASASGDAQTSPMGKSTFEASFNSAWLNHSTSNGKGGYCAPTTGTMSLTDKKGHVLYMYFSGSNCDTGALFSFHHVLNGNFSITGGTGSYEGARGSGTFNSSDDGEATFHAVGSIQL